VVGNHDLCGLVVDHCSASVVVTTPSGTLTSNVNFRISQ